MESHYHRPRYPWSGWYTNHTSSSLSSCTIWTRFRDFPAIVNLSQIQLFIAVEFLDAKYWRRKTFNIDELVVFALLYNDNATSSIIAEWIWRYFTFYIRTGPAPHLERPYYGSQAEYTRNVLYLDVWKSLCKLDLPVHHGFGLFPTVDRHFNIDLAASRIFIHDMLTRDRTRAQPFRFFNLPPELPLHIYDMILGFPDSGIVIRQEGLTAATYTATRRIKHTVSWSEWNRLGYFDDLLIGKSLGAYLEILATSKQMYAEAMHHFYSTNHFVFWDLRALAQFLKKTSPSRLASVTHISVNYLPDDPAPDREIRFEPVSCFNFKKHRWEDQAEPRLSIKKTCKTLAHMEGLRNLEIAFSEAYWKSKRKNPDVLKVTGLQSLRKVRGLTNVKFHGDCDIVRADLVPEMRKPREARKVARRQKAREKHELKMAREKEDELYGHSLDHYEDTLDNLYMQYEGWGNA